MFGFLKKAQLTPEVELIELMQKLKNADKKIIQTLHTALCFQFNIFFTKYEAMEKFEAESQKDKFDYLMKLLEMENKLTAEKMFAESVACKLLGLYLATHLEDKKQSNKHQINVSRNNFENFVQTETL